jgi:hypothetical protein
MAKKYQIGLVLIVGIAIGLLVPRPAEIATAQPAAQSQKWEYQFLPCAPADNFHRTEILKLLDGSDWEYSGFQAAGERGTVYVLFKRKKQ